MKAGAILAALALCIMALTWLRMDAAKDARAAAESAAKDARIDSIKDGVKDHEKIEKMSDDALRHDLLGRVQRAAGPN